MKFELCGSLGTWVIGWKHIQCHRQGKTVFKKKGDICHIYVVHLLFCKDQCTNIFLYIATVSTRKNGSSYLLNLRYIKFLFWLHFPGTITQFKCTFLQIPVKNRNTFRMIYIHQLVIAFKQIYWKLSVSLILWYNSTVYTIIMIISFSAFFQCFPLSVRKIWRYSILFC